MQQDEAFNLLKMGKNIFLTGAAGAGKSYLLNKYINTAFTGIAATHLQGTTIHSWFGIGVRDSLSNKYLEKLQTTQRIKSNYKKSKVLIMQGVC